MQAEPIMRPASPRSQPSPGPPFAALAGSGALSGILSGERGTNNMNQQGQPEHLDAPPLSKTTHEQGWRVGEEWLE